MLTSAVIVFCLINTIIAKDDGMECFIPNSAKRGICINLQECPSIYAMANDFNGPMTSEKLEFLIKSQCGFNGTNPKVCCSESVTDTDYS